MSAGAALTSDKAAGRTLHDSGTGGAILHSGVCFLSLLPFQHRAPGKPKDAGHASREGSQQLGQGRQPSVAGRVIPMAPGTECLGSDLERDEDS